MIGFQESNNVFDLGCGFGSHGLLYSLMDTTLDTYIKDISK